MCLELLSGSRHSPVRSDVASNESPPLALVRDARRPARLQSAFACADHLHPSDAGYKAMAESIDLKLLGVGR